MNKGIDFLFVCLGEVMILFVHVQHRCPQAGGSVRGQGEPVSCCHCMRYVSN